MGFKSRQNARGLAHLATDPKLKELIVRFGPPSLRRGTKPFESLCRTIVGQQLSTKAAATIWQRFHDAVHPVTPERAYGCSDSQLRQAGLSHSKVSYVNDLSLHFINGELSDLKLIKWSDDEVRAKLLRVKGIGPWSVDMFLMFTLGRPDVLAVGDLGIKKGIQTFWNLPSLPTTKQMQELTESWRPYRSLASWYMWRLIDQTP